MERCGACRARMGDEEVCPRCGCDFSLAIRAERQAALLLGRSVDAWADGRQERARALLAASLTLHRTPLGLALGDMLERPFRR
ncbi:hypothetical protein C7C56_013365 [Massilia glaciei]|uniref:Uncharacterized protein n=1 Tax=Massilia glaciei TaxID=1524097 RepID=A0A2U2HK10_9BURK|nr:hypothetical protein C7C56_013365 [Massilia glaciei]